MPLNTLFCLENISLSTGTVRDAVSCDAASCYVLDRGGLGDPEGCVGEQVCFSHAGFPLRQDSLNEPAVCSTKSWESRPYSPYDQSQYGEKAKVPMS